MDLKVVYYSNLKHPYKKYIAREYLPVIGDNMQKNCDIWDGFSKVTFFILIFFIFISSPLLKTWYQKTHNRLYFSLHCIRIFTKKHFKFEKINSRWQKFVSHLLLSKIFKYYCSPQ